MEALAKTEGRPGGGEKGMNIEHIQSFRNDVRRDGSASKM